MSMWHQVEMALGETLAQQEEGLAMLSTKDKRNITTKYVKLYMEMPCSMRLHVSSKMEL
jgi:hypothetical protein